MSKPTTNTDDELLALVDDSVSESARYLIFRDCLFEAAFGPESEVMTNIKPSRRKLDSMKYELANIYSRFYVSARNEKVSFAEVFEKMLAEFKEKEIPVPGELKCFLQDNSTTARGGPPAADRAADLNVAAVFSSAAGVAAVSAAAESTLSIGTTTTSKTVPTIVKADSSEDLAGAASKIVPGSLTNEQQGATNNRDRPVTGGPVSPKIVNGTMTKHPSVTSTSMLLSDTLSRAPELEAPKNVKERRERAKRIMQLQEQLKNEQGLFRRPHGWYKDPDPLKFLPVQAENILQLVRCFRPEISAQKRMKIVGSSSKRGSLLGSKEEGSYKNHYPLVSSSNPSKSASSRPQSPVLLSARRSPSSGAVVAPGSSSPPRLALSSTSAQVVQELVAEGRDVAMDSVSATAGDNNSRVVLSTHESILLHLSSWRVRHPGQIARPRANSTAKHGSDSPPRSPPQFRHKGKLVSTTSSAAPLPSGENGVVGNEKNDLADKNNIVKKSPLSNSTNADNTHATTAAAASTSSAAVLPARGAAAVPNRPSSSSKPSSPRVRLLSDDYSPERQPVRIENQTSSGEEEDEENVQREEQEKPAPPRVRLLSEDNHANTFHNKRGRSKEKSRSSKSSNRKKISKQELASMRRNEVADKLELLQKLLEVKHVEKKGKSLVEYKIASQFNSTAEKENSGNHVEQCAGRAGASSSSHTASTTAPAKSTTSLGLQGLKLSVAKEKYEELLHRCQQTLILQGKATETSLLHKDTTTGTTFSRRHEDPENLLLATAFAYLVASGSLYWGFGPAVYEFVKENLNGQVEAYASPFNHTLPTYCSPFNLDTMFGSLGSLYEVEWAQVFPEQFEPKRSNRKVEEEEALVSKSGRVEDPASKKRKLEQAVLLPTENKSSLKSGMKEAVDEVINQNEASKNIFTVIANPPYIESEIQLCCDMIETLFALEKKAKPAKLLVLSINPDWRPAPCILNLQKMEKKCYEKILAPKEHGYYNYQTCEFVKAQFPSLAFAFGADVDRKTLEKLFTHMGEDPGKTGGGGRRK
ncbi:unnamed protein product [Amoebophrya sp. A120]|nr:unnamed protein product [Amoebophrya sp. A120]|eukprot:GSA120T00018877001.1